ncbi:DNA-directed RNA polymerase subunit sigma [Effusibacillus lacus]|uniref:DNA-directed RNA polymerase subunit sigma n=1 Tax=Effusibacillus lacus TaxID=1348429 RepID=A0A292YQD9_9BACL|nr:DNA-directed RNA polymerase subunit sigma [Effusibacillus lacus]
MYDLHVDQIWRYIKAKVAHPQDAEDLTSEVFLRAYKAWDRFNPDKASVRTWLFTITHRVVIDWLRKKGDVTVDIQEVQVTDSSETPEEEAVKRDLINCLSRNLRRLGHREVEALSLRFGSDLTSREIGTLLGLNEGTTKMMIHRTIKKLREWCL